MSKLFLYRVGAFVTDLVLTSIILIPIFLISQLVLMPEASQMIFGICIVGVFSLKDNYSLQGSFGKRLWGLKLCFYSKKNSKKHNLKRFARNLPLIFWPIEGLVCLLNKGKRIGDYIAQTSVQFV